MKALVYDQPWRKDSGIREVPRPACGENDIIVKVMSASICKGVESEHDNGIGAGSSEYPVTPGHEFAGIVDEIGKNVTKVRIGDRIVADNTEYCGECHYCRRGLPNYCTGAGYLGQNRNGGFAQYVRIKKESAIPIPDTMSFNAAALCEPVSCCIHAVDRAGVKFGDTVAVFGAGSMGLILSQLFSHTSASKVYLISSPGSKLDLAKRLGLTTIEMDRNNYSLHESILLRDHPQGVDIVVDATGSPRVCRESLKLLKKGGKLVQYAYVHSDEQMVLDPHIMFANELSYIISACQSYNFERAVEAISQGIVNADALVTGEYDLDHYYNALDEVLSSRDAVKVIIHPNKDVQETDEKALQP